MSKRCQICASRARKSGLCETHFKMSEQRKAFVKIGTSVPIKKADGTRKWASRETMIPLSQQMQINNLTEILLTPLEED